MKKFYLAGQRYFGNRGCEALVRATAYMLREQFGDVEVLCPSIDPVRDSKQWPGSSDQGVRFVRAVPYPKMLRWWYRGVRVFPLLMQYWIPSRYSIPLDIRRDVMSCDGVIMIGGDNITLDYSPAGLISNTAFSEMFLAEGIPTVLWAGSVGPFSRDPVIERYMADFLKRLDLITIRESITADYLGRIGVSSNMKMVADPAFLMAPEAFDTTDIMPKNHGSGILGLNFSPLISKFGGAHAEADKAYSNIVDFISSAITQHDLSVLLIPHVDPLDGSLLKSDSAYLTPIFERLKYFGKRVKIVPRTFNATQLKYLISGCRFFMGARTHSTIAGFSMGVPTASIAYSVKARGLNKDIFGHERYVIPTTELTTVSLDGALNTLINEESDIRSHLSVKIPELKKRSMLSAVYLAESLSK